MNELSDKPKWTHVQVYQATLGEVYRIYFGSVASRQNLREIDRVQKLF